MWSGKGEEDGMKDLTREKLNKLRWKNNNFENIVFYSYKKNKHAHINEHEMKRLEHSISSLREFNNEISVYIFCDDPSYIPDNFKSEYNVNIEPFVEGFDHDMLSAWSIHRWYNLQYFKDEDYNILYVDTDTIFYQDVGYLFDTYCRYDVYGREEFGFRHDPNTGGGSNIRDRLDSVDACIFDLGGKSEVYKYCLGVILLNNGIHQDIIWSLDELSELMEEFKKSEHFLPIPNPRIIDEYGVWVIFSRLGIDGGLFAVQDVTQGWIEQKHKEFFNPIVLHYTTKGEQDLAKFDDRFSNLLRDFDDLGKEIDPYSVNSIV